MSSSFSPVTDRPSRNRHRERVECPAGRPEVSRMPTPRVLEPQCEWTSADVSDEELWTERFTDAERGELDASLRHALARSYGGLGPTREDFPLATQAPGAD